MGTQKSNWAGLVPYACRFFFGGVKAPVVKRVGTYGTPTSGKNTVYNKAVTSTVVALNINLIGLVQLMDKLEETIIREFGTPRFLINKTPENRATAYVEFEVFISGPTANAQRYFKRELERQWLRTACQAGTGKKQPLRRCTRSG
jgi:hypothetical protein